MAASCCITAILRLVCQASGLNTKRAQHPRGKPRVCGAFGRISDVRNDGLGRSKLLTANQSKVPESLGPMCELEK